MRLLCFVFFFFKQKTAYEIYQCDWSSDVCSSDLKIPVTLFLNAFYESLNDSQVAMGVKNEFDLDIDIKLSENHKHGEIYELHLEYYILNKGDKETTIRDIKYYFLEPINGGMPEISSRLKPHRDQIFTLNQGPLRLLPNDTKEIKDFIPSYLLDETLKMEFTLVHTHGETKLVKDLKIISK